ncbi:hypothetical protein FH144_11610 [Staphylococcus caledonicus]|uniref:hypothetical protein n=1 Tax=Staphylococcus sp. acrmy TaxID=2929076 RepID=UPI001F562AF2|nr:hypothetical protein [Staphylococcus sp. acrmy]MCI2949034.1 hypothetical protein [Staphylococcus sp. acrmy]
MKNNEENVIYSVYGAMKIFRAQAIPGTLYLLKDYIYFEANGILKDSEIKNTFYYKDLKNIKFGVSISPFRIVMTEQNGENWIFDQVPRKEGEKFVELYNEIKER